MAFTRWLTANGQAALDDCNQLAGGGRATGKAGKLPEVQVFLAMHHERAELGLAYLLVVKIEQSEDGPHYYSTC